MILRSKYKPQPLKTIPSTILFILFVFTLSCSPILAKWVLNQRITKDDFIGKTSRENKTYRKAFRALFFENFKEAATLFEEAYQKCLDDFCRVDVSVFSTINHIYMRDYKSARKTIDMALKLGSDDYLAQTVNLILLFEEKKYDELISRINHASKEEKYYRGMYVLLYNTYKSIGRTDMAETTREKVFLTREYIECTSYDNFSIQLIDQLINEVIGLPEDPKGRSCQ